MATIPTPQHQTPAPLSGSLDPRLSLRMPADARTPDSITRDAGSRHLSVGRLNRTCRSHMRDCAHSPQKWAVANVAALSLPRPGRCLRSDADRTKDARQVRLALQPWPLRHPATRIPDVPEASQVEEAGTLPLLSKSRARQSPSKESDPDKARRLSPLPHPGCEGGAPADWTVSRARRTSEFRSRS